MDPDTGELICDTEVTQTVHAVFAGTRDEVTARLVVRRVQDNNHPDTPVSRLALPRNTPHSTVDADVIHGQHAIIETFFPWPTSPPELPRQPRLGHLRGDLPQPARAKSGSL